MHGAPPPSGFGQGRWEGWLGALKPWSAVLRIVAIGGLALELEVNLYVSRGEGWADMSFLPPGISGQ